MNKQISVHNHKCTTHCEHADICYYINGKHKNTEIKISDIDSVIDNISGNKSVYYSGCNLIESFMTFADQIYPVNNKQMTISYTLYKQLKTMINKNDLDNKIQLTVYSLNDLENDELKDIQKMYLIKDDESFNIASNILTHYQNYNNIHFPIYHEWAENNKDKIIILVGLWFNYKDKSTLSLDSCLENYILNNKCVYSENYIDLRYDGTIRRCPFSNEYHDINYDNPDEMFNIPFIPNCIWHNMFYKET